MVGYSLNAMVGYFLNAMVEELLHPNQSENVLARKRYSSTSSVPSIWQASTFNGIPTIQWLHTLPLLWLKNPAPASQEVFVQKEVQYLYRIVYNRRLHFMVFQPNNGRVLPHPMVEEPHTRQSDVLAKKRYSTLYRI